MLITKIILAISIGMLFLAVIVFLSIIILLFIIHPAMEFALKFISVWFEEIMILSGVVALLSATVIIFTTTIYYCIYGSLPWIYF